MAGWQLARRARAMDVDAYHVHDPELLPQALWLRRVTGRPVIYDAHEYLGETTRTKRWIPGPLRRPVAALASGAERAAGRRLTGVVTANEDLAARFGTVLAPRLSTLRGPGGYLPAVDPAVVFTAIYMQFVNYFVVEKMIGARGHLGLGDTEAVRAMATLFQVGLQGLFPVRDGGAEG